MKYLFVFFMIAFVADSPALAAVTKAIPDLSFTGIFGTYNDERLQNGFEKYRRICTKCEAFRYVRFRHLEDIGFTGDEITALLSEYQNEDSKIPDQNALIPAMNEDLQDFHLSVEFDSVRILKESGPDVLYTELASIAGGYLDNNDLAEIIEFISWTTDPMANERKKIGLAVYIFLTIFTCIIIISRRNV